MRTLAKRKYLQGYIYLLLAALCDGYSIYALATVVYHFSSFKLLSIVFSLFGFCIFFTKSVPLLADATLLSDGAKLIARQNTGIVLSSTEKVVVRLANKIFQQNQTSSH